MISLALGFANNACVVKQTESNSIIIEHNECANCNQDGASQGFGFPDMFDFFSTTFNSIIFLEHSHIPKNP